MNERETTRPAPESLVWGVLLILSACVVAFAFQIRHCFVDDAFIGFQYMRNALAGDGFVFLTGNAPVEGVTNIGWLLLLMPLSVGTDPMMVAKLLGLTLVFLAMILTMCLGRNLAEKIARPEDSFALVFPPVLMLATNFDFLYFSLAGMETALLATLLLVMANLVMHRPHSLWLPVLGVFGFLTHPEAAAVYPLYAAMAWVQTKREDRVATRKLFLGEVVFVLSIVLLTAARWFYFGDIVPNTFHSKPSNLQASLENGYATLMGQNSNVAFPITGWLALPVLLLGYRRLRRASTPTADMLAAISAVGLAFAIYGRADWTALSRYFAPYFPASLLLLWAGIIEAIRLLWPAGVRQRTKQAIAAVVALLLVLANISDSRAKMGRMDEYPGYVLASEALIPPADWIKEHTPGDATVATRRIGVLAYFSGRKVFDYTYGLPDAEVARLVAKRGERFDFPTEAALGPLWQARRPDYLLEDGHLMDRIIAKAQGSRERFTIHGVDYCVIARFPIGREAEWVLAQRVGVGRPKAEL